MIIAEEKVPQWSTGKINQQGNDDFYLEMTFQSSMESNATSVSYNLASIDFANSGYGFWAACGREIVAGHNPARSNNKREKQRNWNRSLKGNGGRT